MELTERREYERRIAEADSVRTLHRIATEAQMAHPRDPEVSAIEAACFARAEELIAMGRHGNHALPLRPPAPPDDPLGDWRARAARMNDD